MNLDDSAPGTLDGLRFDGSRLAPAPGSGRSLSPSHSRNSAHPAPSPSTQGEGLHAPASSLKPSRITKRRVMKLKPMGLPEEAAVEPASASPVGPVPAPTGSSQPPSPSVRGSDSRAASAHAAGDPIGLLAPITDELQLIDPATIARAEKILKHTFHDRALLARALTHASIAPTRHQSNERLEFLGDAVLGMIVCEYLYQNYPDLLEGDMTKIKSDAVSRKKCAKLAARLGLDELLLIGKGMQTRSSLPSSLSAAVVESLLGALYVEAGIECVRAFLLPLIGPMIDEIAESGHHQNFKSVLQQHAQQVLSVQPVYHLLEESGPDHDKSFKVVVELGGQRFEPCWSRSKKQAEQAAAERALIALGVLVATEDGKKLRLQSEPEKSEDEEMAGA